MADELKTSEPYDLFVSYARADNQQGLVTSLVEQIKEEHRLFSPSDPLVVFFDTDSIEFGQPWPEQIRKGLRQSKVMLAIVSENYFKSEWCRREWEEYLRVEQSRRFPGEAITPVFIIAPKDLDARFTGATADFPSHARGWWDDLNARPGIEVQQFWPSGVQALRENAVRERLQTFCEHVRSRSEYARSLAAVPRNLRDRNPNFVGRTKELADLRAAIAAHGAAGLCAVSGIGGIGKTSIAIEYAYRFRAEYLGGQFEIDMSTIHDPGVLRERLVGIARDYLGVNIPRDAQSEEQFRIARAAFDRLDPQRPVLLILDNVNEADAALVSTRERGLSLPSPEKAHVLVTTRLGPKALGASLPSISVDRLSAEEALDVLFQYRAFVRLREDPGYVAAIDGVEPAPLPPVGGDVPPDEEWKCALAIANRLGRHTLAVALVGAYLGAHAQLTYQGFLADLETHGIGLALDAVGDDAMVRQVIEHPELMIGKLLSVSLEWLQRVSPVAVRLLDVAAFLPPDCVPVEWLRLLARKDPLLTGTLDPKPFGGDPIDDALVRLADLRYLTGDDHTLRQIHRVIQEVVKRRKHAAADDPFTPSTIEREIAAIAFERIAPLQEGSVRAEFVADLAAVVALASHWLPRGTPEAARLAGASVEPLVRRGDVLSARRMIRSAIDIFERLAKDLPDDVQAQRDLSVSCNKMGALERSAGRTDEARRFFTRGLEISERLAKALPDDVQAQRDLSVSRERLGDLELSAGRTDEARRFFTRALHIAERLAKALPDDIHAQRDLSVSCERMGDLELAAGWIDQARRFFTRALEIRTRLAKTLPNGAQTQRDLSVSCNRMGDLERAVGRTDEASTFYARALDIAERLAKALPHDVQAQRDLSVSCNKMGDLQLAAGRTDEARRFFTRASETRERLAKALPDDVQAQRDLSVSCERMGDLERAAGRTDEARRFFTRAFESYERLLRIVPEDVVMQRSMCVPLERLGTLEHAAGRIGEARRFYTRYLEIAERLAEALPNDVQAQRDLSVSCNKMGDLEQAAGRTDEARRFFTRDLEIAEHLAKALPDDVQAQWDLAVSYFKCGDFAISVENQEEAVEFFRRCHGQLHAMRAKGMLLDPQLSQVWDWLDRIFGGGGGGGA